MTMCNMCGKDMSDDLNFCLQCGSALKDWPQSREVSVGYIHCGLCRRQVENTMRFCNHCGADLNAVGINPDTAENGAGDAEPVVTGLELQDGRERELYRKSNVTYMKGLIPATGTLVITTARISFSPSALYVIFKPFDIDMREVVNAVAAPVIRLGIGLNIITKTEAYKFSFGVVNAGEVKKIIELISKNLCS